MTSSISLLLLLLLMFKKTYCYWGFIVPIIIPNDNDQPAQKSQSPSPISTLPASSSWFKAPMPRREGKVAARLPRSESHEGFEAPAGRKTWHLLGDLHGILTDFNGILVGFAGIYWDFLMGFDLKNYWILMGFHGILWNLIALKKS